MRSRKAISRKRPTQATLVINESAVLDDEQVELEEDCYQTMTANAGPKVRQETLSGIDYTVVPMVMITEGVHAGSNGPLFYPAEELAKTPVVWNHKPVVVYHPTMNGQAISACEPAVISCRKVGIIMNTKYVPGKNGVPGKLRAEAWLETNRLNEVDPRVSKAVKNKAMMEVSTGLFTDNEAAIGKWGKEPYSFIARNYRPDHLAILPDQKGSCSIEDGAGLMRNSQQSHDELRSGLSGLIKTKKTLPTGLAGGMDTPYVRDVFDTFCVYSHGGKMYQQKYSNDENGLNLTGLPTEVVSRQTYSTPDGTVINTGVAMLKKQKTKEQFVDALISNAVSPWEEADRDDLMDMENGMFAKVCANAGIVRKDGQDKIDSGGDDNDEELRDGAGQVKAKKATSKTMIKTSNAKKGKAADDDDDEDDMPTKNQAGELLTVNEYIEHAPPEIRDLLATGLKQAETAKAKAIATITANKANTFTKEFLRTKPLEELQAMAAIAGASQAQPQMRLAANYGGQGDVGTQNEEMDGLPEPLVAPTFNFERKEKTA